jgi:hypothetical protein
MYLTLLNPVEKPVKPQQFVAQFDSIADAIERWQARHSVLFHLERA